MMSRGLIYIMCWLDDMRINLELCCDVQYDKIVEKLTPDRSACRELDASAGGWLYSLTLTAR
jgi:hypothetical protein